MYLMCLKCKTKVTVEIFQDDSIHPSRLPGLPGLPKSSSKTVRTARTSQDFPRHPRTSWKVFPPQNTFLFYSKSFLSDIK